MLYSPSILNVQVLLLWTVTYSEYPTTFKTGQILRAKILEYRCECMMRKNLSCIENGADVNLMPGTKYGIHFCKRRHKFNWNTKYVYESWIIRRTTLHNNNNNNSTTVPLKITISTTVPSRPSIMTSDVGTWRRPHRSIP